MSIGLVKICEVNLLDLSLHKKKYYWDNYLFAKLKGVLWAKENPHGGNEVTRESSKSHFCDNGVYIDVNSIT